MDHLVLFSETTVMHSFTEQFMEKCPYLEILRRWVADTESGAYLVAELDRQAGGDHGLTV